MAKILWLQAPEDKDYPAAESYLNLSLDPAQAKGLVSKLRQAPVQTFKAKDIFRASGHSLLGVSNGHVERDIKKIKDGEKLSPLLLVRDAVHRKVTVADGYHRLCAVYSFDEDADIPCKIV